MSAQQLQKENVKIFKGTPTYYISLVIMLALMFLFRFLPPIGTITSTGMAVVGIFLGLIWGWSTMGLLVPSILSMIAFGFTSLYGDGTEQPEDRQCAQEADHQRNDRLLDIR